MTRLLSVVGVLLTVSLACASGSKQQAMRSPSYDYPADGPWGPITSDGASLGADRQSASDKLRSGPTVGSQGVQGPAYPAKEEKKPAQVQEQKQQQQQQQPEDSEEK